MANKTIYFSHSDERYIEGTLPGLSMSLSAALMAGYRLLVERQQATHDGFHEIQLRVGKDGVYRHKIFMGRKIYRTIAKDKAALREQRVYLTQKGRYVYYERNDADWNYWPTGTQRSTQTNDNPATVKQWGRMEVVDTIDELAAYIPERAVQNLQQSLEQPVEHLDI